MILKIRSILEFKDHFPWWGSWIFGKEFSDGEKACFASHYRLWQECVKLDETIMVIEDDVEISDEFLSNKMIIIWIFKNLITYRRFIM